MALLSLPARGQVPDPRSTPPTQSGRSGENDNGLATRNGHQVNASVGRYTYVEPGARRISIHGFKVGGQYIGTLVLDRRRHWFGRADLRGSIGDVAYDGWCSPFLIRPNTTSPNGYELDLGAASPCSESGDRDGYLEARGLVGKDIVAHRWGISPDGGLGLRHLSNGTGGIRGYRTDDYLYLPLGLTARTRVAARVLSVRLEYDLLLHGWQMTRDSRLGGGDVPATAIAPAFTIDRFTDVSFAQRRGWALRAGATFQVTARWSVEPSYIRWAIGASPVNHETAVFTVNNITAQEQFGVYEPVNTTNELAVSLGFRF